MRYINTLMWALAALFVGGLAIKIGLGPKGDMSGWVMTAVFAAVAGVCAWLAWKDWHAPQAQMPKPQRPSQADQTPKVAAPSSGLADVGSVPLETQIQALAVAGLRLAPGRTVGELLTSWSRQEYETDPYNLLLFMYGSEVEAEPWGRWFSDRGWNFDMECLSEAGDYGRAFEQIVRITGQPDLVTSLSDDFNFNAETATIRYRLKGQPRELTARVDNDWADPEAVAAFVGELERAVGDGRRFWAADNGQASVLFFLADDEAARINALRPGVIVPYLSV